MTREEYRIHIENHLLRNFYEVKEPFGPHRGYAVGNFGYVRKDNKPLTDEDITALKNYDLGQTHVVNVADDKMSANVYWECDSGD